MSYSFNNPCGYCEKIKADPPCEDRKKIEEAISKIHMSNDGTHKGSGLIVMSCQNCKSTL